MLPERPFPPQWPFSFHRRNLHHPPYIDLPCFAKTAFRSFLQATSEYKCFFSLPPRIRYWGGVRQKHAVALFTPPLPRCPLRGKSSTPVPYVGLRFASFLAPTSGMRACCRVGVRRGAASAGWFFLFSVLVVGGLAVSAFGLFVCGSRGLSPAGLGVVSAVSAALAPSVSLVSVGCASGADAGFLAGFSGAGVPCVVSAVGGASGAGFFGGLVSPSVRSFVRSGSGAVVWWAGGRSGSLVARLSARSSASVAVAAAWPSLGLPSVAVGVVAGLAPSGSLRSLRLAAGSGLPVVLWVASPLFAGVGASALARLPRWVGGSWVLGSSVFGGVWASLASVGGFPAFVWLPEGSPKFFDDQTPRKRSAVTNKMHIVFCPKYRLPVLLNWDIRATVETAIRHKAQEFGVEIIEMAIQHDHIHMIANIPQTVALADFMREVKGYSGSMARKNHSELLPKQGMWARRYFAMSVSNKSMASVRKYVSAQAG